MRRDGGAFRPLRLFLTDDQERNGPTFINLFCDGRALQRLKAHVRDLIFLSERGDRPRHLALPEIIALTGVRQP
jgi:hypothetical protein